MRRTKSGQPHAHSKRIQDQGSYTIQSREMLESTFCTALTMLDIWGSEWGGTQEDARLREDIQNYLALIKRREA